MKHLVKQELKLLFRFLSSLPIRQNPNTIYTKKDVLKPLVRASVQNASIENACKWSGTISADTVFYRLGNLSVKDVEEWINGTLDKMVGKAKKKYRLSWKVCIAIDFHKIPYYGQDNVWVRYSKHEKGTDLFLFVITLHIVIKGQRFTVAALPVSKFDFTEKLVERLIQIAKQHFTVQCVLLDRYFEGIECLNMLKTLGMKFIIPKRRNKRAVRVMESMFMQGIERQEFCIRQGNKTASFDLVILKTKDDLVGFVTNMDGSAESIAKLYSSRWGIETGYRVKNCFYAPTCSRNFAARYLLVFLSFLLYNLWVFVNVCWHRIGIYRITAKDMCVWFAWVLDGAVT